MGNSSSFQANPDKHKKSKDKMKSRSSSVRDKDMFDVFIADLRDACDEAKLPAFKKRLQYDIYTWKNGEFGHHSIVIRKHGDSNYSSCTMELCVDNITDPKKPFIFPRTAMFTKGASLKYIENKKWFLKLTIETTLNILAAFTIDMIKHHGTYLSFHNNCQHFTISFIRKIRNYCLNGTYAEYKKRLKNDVEYKELEQQYFGASETFKKEEQIHNQVIKDHEVHRTDNIFDEIPTCQPLTLNAITG